MVKGKCLFIILTLILVNLIDHQTNEHKINKAFNIQYKRLSRSVVSNKIQLQIPNKLSHIFTSLHIPQKNKVTVNNKIKLIN